MPASRAVYSERVGRGSHDRTGDKIGLLLEVVAVMRRVAGTIGEDERGLPASPGASGSLRIVGRVGRRIAHMHNAEVANIDAQFHRRRTEQSTDFSFAEQVFPRDADIRAQLPGVVFTTQALHFGKIP